MQIDGACHCGRITFTADVDPSQVTVCHCTDCQVLSGSPFRVIVPAPLATLQVRGEPARYVKTADSGSRRVQVFCPDCATPLFGMAAHEPTSVTVRVGCVKQRADLPPTKQIWVQSALPWCRDTGGLPASPEQ